MEVKNFHAELYESADAEAQIKETAVRAKSQAEVAVELAKQSLNMQEEVAMELARLRKGVDDVLTVFNHPRGNHPVAEAVLSTASTSPVLQIRTGIEQGSVAEGQAGVRDAGTSGAVPAPSVREMIVKVLAEHVPQEEAVITDSDALTYSDTTGSEDEAHLQVEGLYIACLDHDPGASVESTKPQVGRFLFPDGHDVADSAGKPPSRTKGEVLVKEGRTETTNRLHFREEGAAQGKIVSGTGLRAAIVAYLLREGESRAEGVSLEMVCAHLAPTAAADVKGGLNELVSDGEVFSTIDEEHFNVL